MNTVNTFNSTNPRTTTTEDINCNGFSLHKIADKKYSIIAECVVSQPNSEDDTKSDYVVINNTITLHPGDLVDNMNTPIKSLYFLENRDVIEFE